ncbi:M14 family metallopeptidase [Pseudovibrio sp. Tun.PSC04-5.I4]|uniref:M14 family metallopeptidase n=1 Tax=Pseudovibrio sp. Tun.PSC04-5.I4 TaxID=1798213 RepID=UPI000880B2C6|nr:M14 family metallopeptidase [Pseudovibrio sp. Tun.PSC04-5.I4]SDR25331.1 Succinylglutamate desuccinylase [Pseudovibrio sp. Tun.PSC04-5.I4]
MIIDSIAYPIEIEFPDIIPYKVCNTGVDWITTLDSGVAGPHVMISALVHGNEPCGAVALDWLFKQEVRPVRGKLSLAFMNVAAYNAFDRENPTASRYLDQDFNRVWQSESLDDPEVTRELERAREVRPIVETVDLLLDIHSMQHKNPPLMLAGIQPKGRALARQVADPEWVVCDAGHAEGQRLRDYGGFSASNSKKTALLLETGQHWEAASAPRAIANAIRFLRTTECVSVDFGEDFLVKQPQPVPQRTIEIIAPVTVQSEQFRFAEEFHGMEIIERKGTVIAMDGDTAVKTPHDNCVLIMPNRRLQLGKTAVRLGKLVD